MPVTGPESGSLEVQGRRPDDTSRDRFLWLFWMHGEAGWNQVAPRAEFMLKLTHSTRDTMVRLNLRPLFTRPAMSAGLCTAMRSAGSVLNAIQSDRSDPKDMLKRTMPTAGIGDYPLADAFGPRP